MTDFGCAPNVHRTYAKRMPKVCTTRASTVRGLLLVVLSLLFGAPAATAELPGDTPAAFADLMAHRCAPFVRSDAEFDASDLEEIPAQRAGADGFLHLHTGLRLATYTVEGRRACQIENGSITWSIEDRSTIREASIAFAKKWVAEAHEFVELPAQVENDDSWIVRPLDREGRFLIWVSGKTIDAPALVSVTIGYAVFGEAS